LRHKLYAKRDIMIKSTEVDKTNTAVKQIKFTRLKFCPVLQIEEQAAPAAFLYVQKEVHMKLVDYLKGVENPSNVYVFCVNTNCKGYEDGQKGIFSDKGMEELMFFDSNLDGLLANKKVLFILKDLDLIGKEIKRSRISEDDPTKRLYVYVSFPEESYQTKKEKVKGLLC